jgi:hypothetical protein
MIGEQGAAMLQAMPGCAGGYWARTPQNDIVQHSFWLFDTEENARAAERAFSQLRDMPDAPATFMSIDVCEVVGHAWDPTLIKLVRTPAGVADLDQGCCAHGRLRNLKPNAANTRTIPTFTISRSQNWCLKNRMSRPTTTATSAST